MANQFTSTIEELRDKSDKETNKQLLYNEYKKYTAPQLTPLRDEFVKELIEQFEDLIELFHYKHLHDYI
ncbi:hypothetical protein [Caviibacterium pharyngocola]|uniref:Uncharacterized protein n=1 Tax=Caviibacterium pharyngocola TaxID=28159 RepID=A0A2M8RXY2_9PAST|nr:hypothetical protein [Caviibacterium pharyngocola]PJG83753.1 hypothetical protein CVP04_02525 [Caviibacterium pharyngocola]